MIQNRLWRHNFPTKLASKLLCIRGSRRESKRKQRLILRFKRVSFLKKKRWFSFFPLPYSGGSNQGKAILTFLEKLWCHHQFWITGWFVHIMDEIEATLEWSNNRLSITWYLTGSCHVITDSWITGLPMNKLIYFSSKFEYFNNHCQAVHCPFKIFMDQSVPAVNIPPLGIRTSFLPAPGFSRKILPGELGFRSGQTFPKLTKIYSVFLFLVNVLKRPLPTAGKTLVFFHNNCICFLQHLFLRLAYTSPEKNIN